MLISPGIPNFMLVANAKLEHAQTGFWWVSVIQSISEASNFMLVANAKSEHRKR